MRHFKMLFNSWLAQSVVGFFEVVFLMVFLGMSPASAQMAVHFQGDADAFNVALLDLGAEAEANGKLAGPMSGSLGASSVIDGEESTYWAGIKYRSDLVLVISFSELHDINRIRIVEEYNGSIFHDAEFEYFDGENWHPLFSESKEQPGMDRSFDSVKASKVRMTVKSWNDSDQLLHQAVCITSFEVYAQESQNDQEPEVSGQKSPQTDGPGQPGPPEIDIDGPGQPGKPMISKFRDSTEVG